MNTPGQRGTTLVIGLILLSLVTLLGLAGASTAHVERLLAQNGLFRENAVSAASAGIESAISRIVTLLSTSPGDPAAAAFTSTGVMPGSTDRYETVTRFAGFEVALPQTTGAQLAGAHFEIISTGFGARRAVDRQRADVMFVVDGPAIALDCQPVVPARCLERGDVRRLSWQRIAVE
jgi:Tfp pilus assembly protein PilX